MIVALAGGVGGAKMAHGLSMVVAPQQLTIIVNTADDFDHLGLRICPDLDTVIYTLAGIANPATGWGIAGDTRNVLDAIAERGGPNWFLLGDRDFATHIVRSAGLRNGRSMTEVTTDMSSSLGIEATVLPMSDDSVATMVSTPDGELTFQDYFVRRQQEDEVTGISFVGIEHAVAQPAALAAIRDAEIVLLNPSNPIVSIGPILAINGFADALRSTRATRIAVSPIIGGKALKGPADRMLTSLGHESSALGVARIYQELIDGLVVDSQDAALAADIEALGIRTLATDSIMRNDEDRARLASEIIDFAGSLTRQAVPAQ